MSSALNLPILTPVVEQWSTIPLIFVFLSFFLIGIGIFIGRKYLKTDKSYSIVIGIISILLVSMEIYHEVERYLQFGTYDWSSFPFQFCSVTMYICVLMPFVKDCKFKKVLIMFLALYNFLSGSLPLYLAQGNLTRWPTISGVIFSFAWHCILLLIGSLSIGYLNVGHGFKLERKVILQTFAFFFFITCIAQVLNTIIHYGAGASNFPVPPEGEFKHAGWRENYELDPDSASLFYISPFFQSNITIVYADVWAKAGWVANWALYVVSFGLASMLVYGAIYGIRRLYSLTVKAIKKPKEEVANE